MKKSALILGLLLFAFGSTLLADPIDPVFSIGDPPSGTPITGSTFQFDSNVDGGGVLSFTNATTFDWTSIQFFVTLPQNDSITCFQSTNAIFRACSVSSGPVDSKGNQVYDIGVSVPVTAGGITPGDSFTINLNDLVAGSQPSDPNGAGGWGPDNQFTADVNGAPEPGTWTLLVLGLGLIGFGYRRWSQRLN